MENTAANDSVAFPVIVLISRERFQIKAVLLYDADKVAEIAALKAQAAQKLGGFSTGLGFWGSASPGGLTWVLGGSAVLGLLEGFISGAKQRQGLQLLQTAAAKFEQLSESAVFVPVDRVRNLHSPHPESWSAVRKVAREPLQDRISRAANWVFTGREFQQQYIHNGEDFVNIKTDGGVVCVRWSHVASYVPPSVIAELTRAP
jgi:hypothetical protein